MADIDKPSRSVDRAGGRGARQSMWLRLVRASLANRRARLVVVLLSIVIGAAVVSLVLSIYKDLGARVGRELRGYGANVAAVPEAPGGLLDPRSLDLAAKDFGDRLVGYSPYLFGKVRLGRSEVVLAGLRLGELKKISPYLKLSPIRRDDLSGGPKILAGADLANKLGLRPGEIVGVAYGQNQRTFKVAGLIESGGVEENQVFVELEEAQALLGRPGRAGMAYFSVVAQDADLAGLAAKIGARRHLQLEPISRISQSETRVLDRIKALVFLVAGVILTTSGLAVATAMMAVVIERRREVGLKKALGADSRSILSEFAGEGLAVGFIGGVLGWSVGFVAAGWIGQKVFNSPVAFSAGTIFITVGVSLAVAVLAMVVPVRTALMVEPAVVLKGE